MEGVRQDKVIVASVLAVLHTAMAAWMLMIRAVVQHFAPGPSGKDVVSTTVKGQAGMSGDRLQKSSST